MIKNIITCFLLAGSIPLSAQTIHGKLVDEKDQPLPVGGIKKTPEN